MKNSLNMPFRLTIKSAFNASTLSSVSLSSATVYSIIALTACTFSLSANAAERQGLLLNGSVSALRDDNILNNLKEKSDIALSVSPDVKYLGLVGKHKFLLSYKGTFSAYTEDSNLNNNEHKLAAGARLDHSHKINTEFKLAYDQQTEEPGSTNSSTVSLKEHNKFKTKSALAKIYYGQKSSTGQLVAEYKHGQRDYTNNFQNFRNVLTNQITGTFFYRVAPKTRLLFQASTADYEYKDQILGNGLVFNQSSSQNLYLSGVEWEASAKSTGIFKIGYQDKDYDDVRFTDISGLSYMLDMIWKPNTYTRITLGATRQTTESAIQNEGGFLSTSYSIALSHNIFTRTAVTAKYVIDNDDIVFSSGSAGRTDKRSNLKLGINHSLRTWLNVKLEYKYQEKSSNIDIYNFESNAIELSLETAFE